MPTSDAEEFIARLNRMRRAHDKMLLLYVITHENVLHVGCGITFAFSTKYSHVQQTSFKFSSRLPMQFKNDEFSQAIGLICNQKSLRIGLWLNAVAAAARTPAVVSVLAATPLAVIEIL